MPKSHRCFERRLFCFVSVVQRRRAIKKLQRSKNAERTFFNDEEDRKLEYKVRPCAAACCAASRVPCSHPSSEPERMQSDCSVGQTPPPSHGGMPSRKHRGHGTQLCRAHPTRALAATAGGAEAEEAAGDAQGIDPDEPREGPGHVTAR